MKKFFKKSISFTLLGISLIGINAHARSIGVFEDFELPRWQGVTYTICRCKEYSDTPWVLNVDNLSNCSTVDTYLANSDGERRSNYVVVGCTRSEIPSWGKEGYLYKAVLMNSSSKFSIGYINGSWSPDSID